MTSSTRMFFACAEHLRHRNSFEREDGTPLHYQLVNLKDWCKNRFEVVSQLRINTRSSHHRYDVILLINGLPLVQIELKGLAVSPRRAMQQIVEYKHDPRKRLYQQPALFHAAFYCQQSQRNLVFRQQLR